MTVKKVTKDVFDIIARRNLRNKFHFLTMCCLLAVGDWSFS